MKDHKTNQEFADSDSSFISTCNRSDIKPTKRQASKWRMKKGSAYKSILKRTEENKK